jgi:predicted dehydrogenase
MITHDQILPSLYHLQNAGVLGEISVCAQHGRTLRALAGSEALKRAFTSSSFHAFPSLTDNPNEKHALLYEKVIRDLPPRSIVVAAVPDQLHYDVITTALEANHHVMAVKPLVLSVKDSIEIEKSAYSRGLVVGVEYHKRFDDRSFMARQRYRSGMFGEFKLGTACLLEKWYYRTSNFQNWCTTENSDAFSYIGCHYVDLVHFITGLLPVSVSVYGIKDKYPNGNEGYLWTDARVLWENGACLNVQNALGFPDEAPGTNTQGITMYCSGNGNGSLISHSDQYRGLKYSYTSRPKGEGSTQYAEPSPDYFQYLDLGGKNMVPTGYGYRSIDYILRACLQVEATPAEHRQELLKKMDAAGIMATPANSRYNELVMEAGRLSILNGGREALIDYSEPGVSLRS